MKIIKTILLLSLLAACAPYNIKKDAAPLRNYPVFLQNGLNYAAFKMQVSSAGKTLDALLTLKVSPQGITDISITGGFAAVFLRAYFDGSTFTYDPKGLIQPDDNGKKIFEDIIKTLIVPPSVFVSSTDTAEGGQITFKDEPYTNRYYFKKGLSFPYRMEQRKTIVNKIFTFDGYQVYGQSVLPSTLSVRDSFGKAEITLTLLSVK